MLIEQINDDDDDDDITPLALSKAHICLKSFLFHTK